MDAPFQGQGDRQVSQATDDIPPDVERNLARLGQTPGDVDALSDMKDVFGAVRANTGTGPVAELARAAENLLCAQLDGVVTPCAEAVDLVSQATHGLFTLDTEQRANLAERLDAMASGIGDAPAPNAPSSTAPVTSPATAPTPPLLTIREDGTPVSPGMAANQGAATPPAAPAAGAADVPAAAHATPQADSVASTTVAPQPLPEIAGETNADSAVSPVDAIADAIATAAKQLDRHVGALVTIASGTDEISVAVQQTAGELAKAAAEIRRQSEALAAWTRSAGR